MSYSIYPITLLLLVSGAEAYDFGCQDVWQGPSTNNDPVECILGIANRDFGMLVPPLAGAIITCFLLFIFPLVFLCRIFGACGSNEPRPGSDCCCDGEEWDYVDEEVKLSMYPTGYVKKIKCVGFWVFISSFACVICIVYGTYTAFDAFDNVLLLVKSDVLDWVGNTLEIIKRTVKGPDGNYIAPITNDTFSQITDLFNQAEDQYKSFDKVFRQQRTTITSVLHGISGLPTFSLFFILVFAFLNVRRVAPKVFQCFYFFFGLLFGMTGTALLLIGVIGLMVCGEVTLQQWQSPGIFQWYIVPECESVTVLANVTNQIRSMEVDNSVNACREAMEVCDSSQSFNASTPERLFVCNISDASIATLCGSFEQMNQTILSMPFKFGATALCPTCSAYSDCPSKCTNEASRNKTRESISLINFALNATTIISRFLPQLDCDVLATRLVAPLIQARECSTIGLGLMVMGAGGAFACLGYLWGIVVLCKGQKLFFNRRDLFSDEVIEIEVKAAKWQRERL